MATRIPAPSADRTQLQQIIGGLTEGVILIDPDQTIAWANPKALALHGAKHLADLGSTVSEFRKRFTIATKGSHKLPPGQDPMGRLLAGEAFNEDVVEVAEVNGDRRWIHQIRTLVLTDKKGKPDCLVLIINDETDRFNAEERFESAFRANPAPAIIVRLADLRYVRVNKGFLELTGMTKEDLLGRSMHEFDVLAITDRRELALKRLHAGETIPQMEGCLVLPDGQERTVLLGGQPIVIGDARCMLFTFADLHSRQQAQHALKHSEERFSKAFHLAPGPMAILALDGFRFMEVNAAFTDAMGWHQAEVAGRPEHELWGEEVVRAGLEQRIRADGHIRNMDVRLRTKSGAVGDYLVSAETVDINGVACVLSLMVDITERRQTETQLLAAVESVMQDTSWLGQRIVERLAAFNGGWQDATKVPEISALPERIREVLSLIAQGLSDEDIAGRLGIAKNTVRNHVSAIYGKLGIRKRSAVVVWARERGLGATAKVQNKQRKPRPPRRK